MKASLRFKLLLSFEALVLIATLIGVAAILTTHFSQASFEHILHIYLPIAQNNQEIERQILQLKGKAEKSEIRETLAGLEDVHQLRALVKEGQGMALRSGERDLVDRYNQITEYLNQYEESYVKTDYVENLTALIPKIQKEAGEISIFGWNLLNNTHQKTDQLIGRVQKTLILAISVVIVLAWILGVSLAKHITRPINSLVEIFTRMAKGDLHQRLEVKTKDEIQVLAEAANSMAGQLEKRIENQGKILEITRITGSYIKMETLLDNLLAGLLKIFHFQAGAFYLFEREKDLLVLRAGKGLNQAPGSRATLKPGQGLIGASATTKENQVLENIPKDTIFILQSIVGESLPNQMVNIPLYFQDELLGVLTMAGFYQVTEDHLKVLQIITNQLSIAIANSQAYDLVQSQAEELRQKGEELTMQNEELQNQAEELEAQSEELSCQQRELELKNLQIKEADRLKTEFLANISHELRTPLSSIISFSRHLLDRIPGQLNEEQEKQIRIIAKNGKNLLQLIDDILDLSKIEQGKIEIKYQTFQPEELVNEIKGNRSLPPHLATDAG